MDNPSQKYKCSNKKHSFDNVFIISKSKSDLIESDRGEDFCNNIFQDFLNKNKDKIYFRNTSLGAVFAECVIYSIRDLLKKVVFGRGDGNWIDVLLTITKQFSNRVHSSTKLSPIPASLKTNEGYVFHNLLEKRKKVNQKLT